MAETRQSVAAVYAIVGTEDFLRREALRDVLALVGSEDDLGPTRLDGETATLAEVLDELRTLSFFGGRRVVIVSDADTLITANRAALEKYCEAPAPNGCLILLCDRMPKNTRLYKIIHTKHAVVEAEPPASRGMGLWITQRAARVYGKRIDRAAAALLHELIGDAPGMLDSELSKLCTYVGSRAEIGRSDVEALVGHVREEKVFAVTDAMAVGDTAGAVRQWEQVLATDRAAPGRALAGLAWGVRRLLEARRDYDRGVSLSELSRRVFTDPATLRQRLERSSVAALERQLAGLLEADLAVKTGRSDLEVAGIRYIVEHSAQAPTRGRARAAR